MEYRHGGENINKLLTNVKTPDDAYRACGLAVIAFAVEDYRKADEVGDTYKMQSIVRFLHSNLFDILSGGANPDYILRLLKEERREK